MPVPVTGKRNKRIYVLYEKYITSEGGGGCSANLETIYYFQGGGGSMDVRHIKYGRKHLLKTYAPSGLAGRGTSVILHFRTTP